MQVPEDTKFFFEYRVIKGWFERKRYAPVFIIAKKGVEQVFVAKDPDHTDVEEMIRYTKARYVARFGPFPAGYRMDSSEWSWFNRITGYRIIFKIDGFEFDVRFGNKEDMIEILPVKDSQKGTVVAKLGGKNLTADQLGFELERRFVAWHTAIQNALNQVDTINPNRPLPFQARWEI